MAKCQAERQAKRQAERDRILHATRKKKSRLPSGPSEWSDRCLMMREQLEGYRRYAKEIATRCQAISKTRCLNYCKEFGLDPSSIHPEVFRCVKDLVRGVEDIIDFKSHEATLPPGITP